MFPIYVYLLCPIQTCAYIMLQIMSTGDQKQNGIFWEEENMFLYLGTKIRIRYIFRTENLFNPYINLRTSILLLIIITNKIVMNDDALLV